MCEKWPLILKSSSPRVRVTVEKLTQENSRETAGTTPVIKNIRKRIASAAGLVRTAGVDTLFSYPATRLGKVPWQKLALRFADECVLVVLGLAVLVANSTISFGSAGRDNSLAATALSRHPQHNVALYSELFSTTATITQGQGFIPAASAQEQLEAVAPPASQFAGASTNIASVNKIDEEDGLVAGIPDSIQGMLDSQIQVYETKPGDTLGAVAAKFEIDINTIRWSNNLTTDTIKPGWFLVIPSVKGVLVKADEDTTIPGIASKFGCQEERIVSFNGLAGADSVEPGQYVMCPDGRVTAPVVPQAPAASGKRAIGVSYSSIPDIAGTNNWFVKGNCTWYVAKKMVIKFHGNANRWLQNAAAAGYKTGKIPMARSAVVTSLGGRYGHVGFVESVNADGTFKISEMNYEGLYKLTYRTLSASEVVGFIYPLE